MSISFREKQLIKVFSLKKHPFAVDAFFETSLVLAFAVKKEVLQPLIPPCLTLDTFKDEWGFVAIALVKTKDLRPKGFPKIMGNDFILAGFRVFVRYVDVRGKRLRGLYILKSETNKTRMAFFGNAFTHYNYQTTDISFEKQPQRISVTSKKSQIDIEILLNENPQLPIDSPFADWKEARRFEGPLPFTFTYDSQTDEVLIIEGVRQNWEPQPVEVMKYETGFLNSDLFTTARLANAFVVENIPYSWKKGKIEKWTP